MKVTPLKKQSKKNQRKFHAAKRGTWNGVSPVTRIVQSKRIYDRNRTKQESRQSGDLKTPLQSELSGVGHSGVFLISLVFSMLSRLA